MAGTIYAECKSCGREFGQPDDPGRKRVYCTDACRQRAYRSRGGRASGTHRESDRARQRREADEAWAREKARQEQARERMRRNRGRGQEQTETPEWTQERDDDNRETARRRRTCHLLYVRAAHKSTPETEADLCREKADKIRAQYGL